MKKGETEVTAVRAAVCVDAMPSSRRSPMVPDATRAARPATGSVRQDEAAARRPLQRCDADHGGQVHRTVDVWVNDAGRDLLLVYGGGKPVRVDAEQEQ